MVRAARLVARLALLAIVALVTPNPAPGQAPPRMSSRDRVSPARGERMESLLSRAFPGATFDWEGEQLVHRDGRREPFSFTFYEERPQLAEQSTFAVASHAPGEQGRAALKQLQTFRHLPAAVPHCKLSIMRTDSGGRVLGYKETGLDVGDVLSTCDRVDFDYAYESAGVLPPPLRGVPAPSWPWILVNCTTGHALSDAWATITWAAVLDTETMQWVSRLPVFFNGQRRDGRSAAFAIRNDRGMSTRGTWIFSGFNERGDAPRWQFPAACEAGRCKVDPQPVLDAALQSPAWK